eukprot:345659-Chlamydomonas_euryale.AAC.3
MPQDSPGHPHPVAIGSLQRAGARGSLCTREVPLVSEATVVGWTDVEELRSCTEAAQKLYTAARDFFQGIMILRLARQDFEVNTPRFGVGRNAAGHGGCHAGVGKAGAEKAGVGKAADDKAGVEKAGVEKAEVGKSGVEKAGVEKAGDDKAGVEKAGASMETAPPAGIGDGMQREAMRTHLGLATRLPRRVGRVEVASLPSTPNLQPPTLNPQVPKEGGAAYTLRQAPTLRPLAPPENVTLHTLCHGSVLRLRTSQAWSSATLACGAVGAPPSAAGFCDTAGSRRLTWIDASDPDGSNDAVPGSAALPPRAPPAAPAAPSSLRLLPAARSPSGSPRAGRVIQSVSGRPRMRRACSPPSTTSDARIKSISGDSSSITARNVSIT